MKNNKNDSIGCTVDTCKYHCKDSNCCSRDGIEVGCCNCAVDSVDATCCQSFEMKGSF